MKKPTCTVRVIVNPTTKPSFSLNFEGEHVAVKITTPTASHLTELSDKMLLTLGPAMGHWHYNVQFIFKAVPEPVKTNTRFKNSIYRIFGSPKVTQTPLRLAPAFVPTVDLENVEQELTHPPGLGEMSENDVMNCANLVKAQIDQYGAAPNLEIRTPKGVRKILGYMRSITARPHLSQTDAMRIADMVVKN